MNQFTTMRIKRSDALALEGQANGTLILCFHFFRLITVILVAPFVLKYLLS